jgi:hypothetical protein
MIEVDVSTHRIAEITHKALGDKATLEQILTVWYGIG